MLIKYNRNYVSINQRKVMLTIQLNKTIVSKWRSGCERVLNVLLYLVAFRTVSLSSLKILVSLMNMHLLNEYKAQLIGQHLLMLGKSAIVDLDDKLYISLTHGQNVVKNVLLTSELNLISLSAKSICC